MSTASIPTHVSISAQRVFTPFDWFWYVLLTCVKLAALGLAGAYWFGLRRDWSENPFTFGLVSAIMGLVVAGNLMRWLTLMFMAKPLVLAPIPADKFRVAAITTCVPDVEPASFLRRTLEGLLALDYPHDTWVLDEGDDEQVRALCRELGVHHFTRRNVPRLCTASGRFASQTKHGNYNAWLDAVGQSRYDVLLAFDPDHVPMPQFASRLLPYFIDPRVGYVQAPQVYGNQHVSWIAAGAAEETYAYYSTLQMAAFGAGNTVLMGCHNAQRIAALVAIGGIPDHAAEDLLATVRYHEAGWKGVYVPEVLAIGLAPFYWAAYLGQQLRWARALIDIKYRHLRMARKRGVVSKTIHWMQGFGYLQDAILALAVLGMFMALLATGTGAAAFVRLHSVEMLVAAILFFVVDLYRQCFSLLPKIEAGIHWRTAILRAAKWPLVLQAFWGVVRNHRFGYVVTPKVSVPRRRPMLLLPHSIIAGLVFLMWSIGVARGSKVPTGVYVYAAAMILFSLLLVALEIFKVGRLATEKRS
jgi:cellulose synthase/poly-beta-1,6-N-acetylglucosamine synthase-like glycosyltransferase